MPAQTRAYWEGVYGRRPLTQVSWYEAYPGKSLELIHASGIKPDAPLIDVGGGASFLLDELLREGFFDLTALDISAAVLAKLHDRLPQAPHAKVSLIQGDVTAFRPERQYALWHDRAVFHFLVQQSDQTRYVEALRKAVAPGGHVIIATFGPAGPRRCSGLPVQRYDAASLTRALGSEFRLLHSQLVGHRTPAGVTQQFLYTRYQRA
jgi:SAM-dependent methyltransferase